MEGGFDAAFVYFSSYVLHYSYRSVAEGLSDLPSAALSCHEAAAEIQSPIIK